MFENSVVKFTNDKNLLSQSFTSTFSIKKYERGKNCDIENLGRERHDYNEDLRNCLRQGNIHRYLIEVDYL